MSLRIGGYAAIAGGVLWFSGLAYGAASAAVGADAGMPMAALMIVVADAALLVALAGLSAFQARRYPRLTWAAFVLPARGGRPLDRRTGRHRATSAIARSLRRQSLVRVAARHAGARRRIGDLRPCDVADRRPSAPGRGAARRRRAGGRAVRDRRDRWRCVRIPCSGSRSSGACSCSRPAGSRSDGAPSGSTRDAVATGAASPDSADLRRYG